MIYRGEGARGLLNYLAGKEGALLLSTNLDGASPRAFARQMGEVRRLYYREHVAQPVAHITLRPAPGEDLADHEWQDAAQLALERLGYDNSPYVAYLHDHGEGRHLHVATYRVNFEGRLVSDSNDRFKLMQVARELEQAYGLEVATPRHATRLTRAEIERRLRDPGREAAQQTLRDAIDQAAAKHQTLRAFLTELHRLGLQPNLKVARKTGAAQGITFTLPDGSTIKGSDLGKKYSLAGICNRHELRLDLTPEGSYLVVSEVSQREYRNLEREGLASDLALRYGSRRTLYWQLPPGDEVNFVDLIALRLPHRLLGYADELPIPSEATPDLVGRARKAQLLLELAEQGPSIAPPLPLPEATAHEVQPTPARSSTQAERAERCQTLSAALLSASAISPSDAAILRADYHEAMVNALQLRRDGSGPPETPEFRPYETLPSRQLLAELKEASAHTSKTEGTDLYNQLFQEASLRGLLAAPGETGEIPREPEPHSTPEFRLYETLPSHQLRQLLADLEEASAQAPRAEGADLYNQLFGEASFRGLLAISGETVEPPREPDLESWSSEQLLAGLREAARESNSDDLDLVSMAKDRYDELFEEAALRGLLTAPGQEFGFLLADLALSAQDMAAAAQGGDFKAFASAADRYSVLEGELSQARALSDQGSVSLAEEAQPGLVSLGFWSSRHGRHPKRKEKTP